MIFYSSDSHYNHYNIISYSSRPFASIEEMNRVMIDRWNKRVGQRDIVYFLGDFAMGNKHLIPEIRKKLNGKIIVIKGNHDPSATKMLKYGFNEVHNRLTIIDNGYTLLLCHYPIYDLSGNNYCDYMLHGHVHEKWARQDKLINVGVDVSNFYPLTLSELLARK